MTTFAGAEFAGAPPAEIATSRRAKSAGSSFPRRVATIAKGCNGCRGSALASYKRDESRLPVGTADEEARERVIVRLRNRVELVVVASCATNGDAEERLAHHIKAIVHPVRLVLADVHGRMHFFAEEPEARAED